MMKVANLQKTSVILGIIIVASVLLAILIPKLILVKQAVRYNMEYVGGIDAEITAYKEKNEQLEQRVAFLRGKFGIEKLARENFNLKKDGEIVYSFVAGSATSEVPEVLPAAAIPPQKSGPYFNSWKQYFLRK